MISENLFVFVLGKFKFLEHLVFRRKSHGVFFKVLKGNIR